MVEFPKRKNKKREELIFLILFFQKVINFPAYIISNTANTGSRSRGELFLKNFIFQNFFDFFSYFIEHNVVNHRLLSFE